MTKPGYETISGAEPGRIDRERKGKDDETAELHKPDGRWRKLAADKPALMLCHTGAEDARTESGEQNAQDMDHAVASVPRALRIREDVGRVTRDAILAAQAKLAASSTMTASKPTNSQSPAAKPVKRLRETISASTSGTSAKSVAAAASPSIQARRAGRIIAHASIVPQAINRL